MIRFILKYEFYSISFFKNYYLHTYFNSKENFTKAILPILEVLQFMKFGIECNIKNLAYIFKYILQQVLQTFLPSDIIYQIMKLAKRRIFNLLKCQIANMIILPPLFFSLRST